MSYPRVRLLARELEVLDDDRLIVDFGKASAVKLVVAALAVAAPHDLHRRTIQRLTGYTAVEAAAKRMRTRSGLQFKTSPPRTLRLELAPHEIDFHRVVEESERPLHEATVESTRAALDFVGDGGPCDELRELPEAFQMFEAAHEELRKRLRALQRKRILIVEDQIGEELVRQLARHECTLVTSYEAFLDLPDLKAFDLALVDLHLTPSLEDQRGDTVRREMESAGVSYPIIMMTANAWEEMDVVRYASENGVLAVILKGRKDTAAQSRGVVKRVVELLDEDLDAAMMERLRQQLVAVRDTAMHSMNFTWLPDKREKMNQAWADLWLVADGKDPGEIRAAIRRFKDHWA